MMGLPRYARSQSPGRCDYPYCSPEYPDSQGHQGYQRAGLITGDELALIKRIDKQPRTKIESILVTDGLQYALLYLTLLKKIERVDTLQNILVLMGDALSGE
jgi:hypothetical protein